MDQSLKDVAQQGNIETLYELIQKDANVLDRIDDIPFVETPLHIAASTGRTGFAMEIMRLKPSFARKLNQDGFSPMHLALQEYHALENYPILQRKQAQLVDWLLDVDKDLVRVPGRKGVTPFHYVAQMGNLDFFKKFSKGCPKAFEDVTIQRENVLHVALKHGKAEAFQCLLGWIQQACFKGSSSWESKLLCLNDEEDNTLLHIAVSRKQPEVVSLLLDTRFVDLDAKNLEGHTVFDILERQTQAKVDNQRISDMLMARKHPPRCLTALGYYLLSPLIVMPRQFHVRLGFVNFFQILEKRCVRIRRLQTVITEERRNALLVVAVLIITVTYQAALSPDKQPNEFNCTAPINATYANHYFNFTALNPINATGANQYFNCTARFNATSSEVERSRNQAEDLFLFMNTLTFYLANVTLLIFLPHDLLGLVLFGLIIFLSLGYTISTPVFNAPIVSIFSAWLLVPTYFLFLITMLVVAGGDKFFSSDIL